MRDYNLRATTQGLLVPVDNHRPIPIDLGLATLTATYSQPMMVEAPAPETYLPTPNAAPPPLPRDLAEGTADGLAPVVRRRDAKDTEPMTAILTDDEHPLFGAPTPE